MAAIDWEVVVKLVNCAGCDRELLGDSVRNHPDLPDWAPTEGIAGRILDRPYCANCLGLE